MTKQRACILKVLRSDKCHHTAEEIFSLAKAVLPTISRATVYNNLKALEEDGLIRRITGDNGADRYDNSFIPHGHTVCVKCGRVDDFDIPDFDSEIIGAIGKTPVSYELKVRIVCDCCLKKAN